MSKDKLIALDNAGNLGWSSNGRPFRKLRPEDDKGHPLYNLWIDINRLYKSKEKIRISNTKTYSFIRKNY
ncbi:hypothetical protein [Brachyspira hyodysenteriae]|uniref:hypothetical protein n=1 Tax=Brachyspira hyodysenteriae TaxID=159 RepID=UPI0022CD3A7A|nr:hypothetical protein [Brachyspira hyodysenteriae]MCZ9993716.1 hypothetical protein [Brachyspira hyodysenteriae]